MADESHEVPTRMLSSYAAALQTGDEEQINSLDKSEAYFYVCEKLGIDPGANHPDNHNGRVTTEKLREIAVAIENATSDNEGDN